MRTCARNCPRSGASNALEWRHNERDSVSNHRLLGCLLKRLFRRRSKKTSKLRVTGLCERNPPVTRKIFLWRHHDRKCFHSMTSSWFVHLLITWNLNFINLHLIQWYAMRPLFLYTRHEKADCVWFSCPVSIVSIMYYPSTYIRWLHMCFNSPSYTIVSFIMIIKWCGQII